MVYVYIYIDTYIFIYMIERRRSQTAHYSGACELSHDMKQSSIQANMLVPSQPHGHSSAHWLNGHAGCTVTR